MIHGPRITSWANATVILNTPTLMLEIGTFKRNGERKESDKQLRRNGKPWAIRPNVASV